jgi:8-oxo-dGTP diphosphatase
MERSVAGVIIRGRRALLAQRGPSGSFEGRWEFPGGKVEEGESDPDALVREYEEELGLEVRATRLLGEVTFPHRGVERVLAAWLLEAPAFENLELAEHAAYRWADAAEIKSLSLVDSDRKVLEFVLPLLKD